MSEAKKLKVSGMSCGNCAKSVTKAVETVDGVEEVTVNLATGEVTYSTVKPVDEKAVKDNITKIGFGVEE